MSFKFTELQTTNSYGILEIKPFKENPNFIYPSKFFEVIKKNPYNAERLNKLEIPVKVHYSNRREKDRVIGYVSDFTNAGIFNLHLYNMVSSKNVIEALNESKTKLYMLGTGCFIEDTTTIDAKCYRLEEVYFIIDTKDKKQ